MDRTTIIMILFALYTGLLYGQNLQIEWQQCLGGSNTENCKDLYQTTNGYFILGSSMSNDGDVTFNHGGADVWLVKVDGTGNIIWEKSFGGSNGDGAYKILPADNGSFYILGSSDSEDGDISEDPYPASTDFWIVKIDSVGNIIWDKILGGNMLDQMSSGTITNDGGMVAIGWSNSNDGDVTSPYGGYDMWMVKLNSEGDKEWDFSIGTDGQDIGQAIMQTSDGGFLVGGSSTIGNGGNIICTPHSWAAEAILVKLDTDLNIEWQQCYGGSDHDGATALEEVSDGYIFGGYASSNDGDISGWHGEGDIWVVKVDFFGSIIWQKCLGGSRFEGNAKLTKTDNEDILVSGATQSIDGDVTGNHTISEYEHDIWVVKLNSSGDLLWEQCFGGIWDEQVSFGFLQKADNNFVIAGQTDFGPSFDVACTPHGGIYDRDFWVFEVKDTTTNVVVNEIGNPIVMVYPNPAKDYVVFEMPIKVIKNAVIPNHWESESESERARNPSFALWTISNFKENDISRNSKGVSHATTQTQTQGFDMTGGVDGAVVVISNILGQMVTQLPIKAEKSIWDTREIKRGIYFYTVIVEGGRYSSGKIVKQ